MLMPAEEESVRGKLQRLCSLIGEQMHRQKEERAKKKVVVETDVTEEGRKFREDII